MKTIQHGPTRVITNAIEAVTLVNQDAIFVVGNPKPLVLSSSHVTIHTHSGGVHVQRFVGAGHRGHAEACYQDIIEAIA